MGHSLWVGLLYSDSQDFAGGVPTTYTGNLRKTKKANTSLSYLSSLTCFNKLSYRSYEGVSYKGAHMSTELNHQLVRSIGLALNKRGSCMTNDETLNLFAFPSDVLEKVCHEMKNASGLNSPAAFFFGRCRNYTLESGRKPDWGRVNELRDSGYRVLSESEERVNNNGKESKERPQREQAKVSYNDYIQQAQATAQKAQAQSLSVSQKYQIRKWKEQREQALAANNQGWANALTQMIEDIENPRVKSIEEQIAGWVQAVTDNATLLEGSPYKPMLMKIAQSNLEHLRSQLGSNTAKDITQSNVVVAPPSQKRNPVADLKVSAYTGESDEAMLHDSGECSPDAQTSFISGSAL